MYNLDFLKIFPPTVEELFVYLLSESVLHQVHPAGWYCFTYWAEFSVGHSFVKFFIKAAMVIRSVTKMVFSQTNLY